MRLSDFFIPLIAFVRSYENATLGSPQEVSDSIDLMIQQARTEALNAGVSIETFQQGLFPVAAWADERIARRKTWQSAMAWQPFLLQRKYFKTSVAGREFFTRLELLTPQDTAVRELYLLCLSLGFVGRYGAVGDGAQLESIRFSQYKQFLHDTELVDVGKNKPLFPTAYRNVHGDTRKHSGHWGRWLSPVSLALILIPVLLLSLLMYALNADLESTAHTFRQSIGL